MQTIDSILSAVHTAKTCSKVQLRRYLKAFGIQPVGPRQRPQIYPDDSAARILYRLGINGNGGSVGNATLPHRERRAATSQKSLLQLPALRQARGSYAKTKPAPAAKSAHNRKGKKA